MGHNIFRQSFSLSLKLLLFMAAINVLFKIKYWKLFLCSYSRINTLSTTHFLLFFPPLSTTKFNHLLWPIRLLHSFANTGLKSYLLHLPSSPVCLISMLEQRLESRDMDDLCFKAVRFFVQFFGWRSYCL